jgi:hypothetical protein
MLKKTVATTGFVAAIGGGIITSIPASAQVPGDDHTYRNSSRHSRSDAFRHYHRNRNFNSNTTDEINRIRLPFNSTNTLTPTVNVSPAAVPQVVQVPAT